MAFTGNVYLISFTGIKVRTLLVECGKSGVASGLSKGTEEHQW